MNGSTCMPPTGLAAALNNPKKRFRRNRSTKMGPREPTYLNASSPLTLNSDVPSSRPTPSCCRTSALPLIVTELPFAAPIKIVTGDATLITSTIFQR